MSESTKELSGAELDRLVAEKLMGWERVDGQTALAPFAYRRPDGHIVHPYSAPNYSSSIEAAMQIVERLITEPHHYRVLTDQGGDHGSVLVEIKQVSGGAWTFIARVEAETLPLAICRAALAAMEQQQNR